MVKIDNQEFKILPYHIGFIMDGNGRWAQKRGFSRLKGHDMGVKTVKNILKLALKYDIKIITLFAFSTENWNRPQKEVEHLFKLLDKYFFENLQDFIKKGIALKIIGDVTKFPDALQKKIDNFIDKTKHLDKLTLNLALNYGSKDEIIKAVNDVIKSGVKSVTEESFKEYLYTKSQKDPDLIVRTSGEKRLSNFLLFQAAYAELFFTDTMWPDFGEENFIEMLREYEKRNRRFGAL